MNSLIVGIADCRVVQQADCELVTYALGSCIAVAVHDPVAHVGGLLHFMIPNPEMQRVDVNPFRCGQTGIPILLERVFAAGADRKRLAVYLAGGAQMLDQTKMFNMGNRNHTAARHMLWKAGLTTTAERVGGSNSRTVGLDLSTGHFWVHEQGLQRQILPQKGDGRSQR